MCEVNWTKNNPNILGMENAGESSEEQNVEEF